MRKLKKYLNRTLKAKSPSTKPVIKHATTFVNTRTKEPSSNPESIKVLDKVADTKNRASKYPENDEAGPSGESSSPENSREKLFAKSRCEKKWSKCEVRKCRALKATEVTAEADSNIKLQRLIVKVKELKKNIEEYGIIKERTEDIIILKKIATTQTQVPPIDSIASALITLEFCQKQIVHIEEFLRNKHNHMKIEDKRLNCCDIATPHVHTFVDGLSAVITFSVEEKHPVACDNEDKPTTSQGLSTELNKEEENCGVFGEHKDEQLRVVPQTITTAVLYGKRGEISPPESFISANAPWIKKR